MFRVYFAQECTPSQHFLRSGEEQCDLMASSRDCEIRDARFPTHLHSSKQKDWQKRWPPCTETALAVLRQINLAIAMIRSAHESTEYYRMPRGFAATLPPDASTGRPRGSPLSILSPCAADLGLRLQNAMRRCGKAWIDTVLAWPNSGYRLLVYSQHEATRRLRPSTRVQLRRRPVVSSGLTMAIR